MIKLSTIVVGELMKSGEASLQTGPFGTQLKASDYVGEGVPVINVRNIGNGRLRAEKLEYLDERMADKLDAHRLEPGDIVFGRKGAVDRHLLVDETTAGWIQGSDCLRLRIQSKRVFPPFASFYFDTKGHKDWMDALCSFGATMTSLNQDIVSRITLPFPDYTTQKKIAAILTAYDDLIENNQRHIAALEKMAEELYREWFVRLRFPGHDKVKLVKGVPEGWKPISLSKLAFFTMGQSPSSDYYNEVGDGLPFHQGVGTYGSRFPNHEVYCSTEGRVAIEGDILFSVRAPVGRLNIADRDIIIGRGLAAVRHKQALQSYLFYVLRINFAKEDTIGNGSIFNSVGKDELAKFKIYNPTQGLDAQFNEIAAPIDRQIEGLTKSNQALRQTRDLLLPRLISGKLRVDDLDIQFPPSMATE